MEKNNYYSQGNHGPIVRSEKKIKTIGFSHPNTLRPGPYRLFSVRVRLLWQ